MPEQVVPELTQRERDLATIRSHVRGAPLTDEEADKMLHGVQEGQLSHYLYARLTSFMQTFYKAMHGVRPASPSEVVGIKNSRSKKLKARNAEKQGRKSSRRGT